MRRNRRFIIFIILEFSALDLLSGAVIRAQDVDMKEVPTCLSCGMRREFFDHGWMIIEFKDGKKIGTCSLNYTAVELVTNPGRKPKMIRVADYNTMELLVSDEAFWVIVEKKEGVTTKRAKWAFGDKTAAEAFVRDVITGLASDNSHTA